MQKKSSEMRSQRTRWEVQNKKQTINAEEEWLCANENLNRKRRNEKGRESLAGIYSQFTLHFQDCSIRIIHSIRTNGASRGLLPQNSFRSHGLEVRLIKLNELADDKTASWGLGDMTRWHAQWWDSSPGFSVGSTRSRDSPARGRWQLYIARSGELADLLSERVLRSLRTIFCPNLVGECRRP